jgi:hypothetical protein
MTNYPTAPSTSAGRFAPPRPARRTLAAQFVLPLALCLVQGCGKGKVSFTRPPDPALDPTIQQLNRLAQDGSEIQSKADVLVEVLGKPGEERLRFLRPKLQPFAGQDGASLIEIAATLRGLARTNHSAVVLAERTGFSTVAVSNAVHQFRASGFGSVQVLLVAWGQEFPIPEP